LVTGCADSVKPIRIENSSPGTGLTYAPLDSDTTYYRVHIYWEGFDRDGEVVRFLFAIDADTSLPVPQWRSTSKNDSTFAFLVDPVSDVRGHVFMVSAVDNDGFYDRSPARRFFSVKTRPPISRIIRGPSSMSRVGQNFTFEMFGSDPDGSLIGGPAWVDSFECILLRVGMAAAPGQPTLPPFDQTTYVDLINRAVGRTLPAPYDGWSWKGIRGTMKRYQFSSPGPYVFAERAVDAAGSAEKGLSYGTNIRYFTVAMSPPPPPGPTLVITCSALNRSIVTSGPDDVPREAIQLLEGESIRFSWSASTGNYGDEFRYAYAVDDPSQIGTLDPRRTEVTLTPAQLSPGMHTLYVRVGADPGLITNAVIPILVIHPPFKEPGAAREILYVDDSLSPGSTTQRVGNYPSDGEETSWWMSAILPQLGVPAVEWDTYFAGLQGVEGREPPTLSDLARFSTVVWNVDFNNGFTSPTGLHKTLFSQAQSHLAAYVRGGGTLILSGFTIASNVSEPTTTLYAYGSRGGICADLEPGPAYDNSFFARNYMGIDGALANYQALRTLGARDFIAAAPTVAGVTSGYDSALVDRGPLGSGAKWITYVGGEPNTNASPGLGQVDGWLMAENFGCEPSASAVFTPENPSLPIAQPILVYHGANIGIDEEVGPSPREGMVVGVQVQAHGLGAGDSPTFDRDHSLGRMVHLAFPLYFLRDEDAVRVLQAAYNYVNASPTLP
jgi:hypothetical protein